MSASHTTAYPLQWPAGRARSKAAKRAAFRATFGAARDGLLRELAALGALNVTLSTNVELRRDGLPYANAAEPTDPGVAVYFALKQGAALVPYALACDRWDRVRDNLTAIRHTVAAIRGIRRWGTGEMLRAAFEGFKALPPAGGAANPPGAVRVQRPWWHVLGVPAHEATATVELRYRALAKQSHPDRNPGDAEALARWHEIDAAYTAFKRERGL